MAAEAIPQAVRNWRREVGISLIEYMKKASAAILLILLCLGGIAFFRRRGRLADSYFRMNPVLMALDRDGDRTISATEIAAAPAVLRTLDRNGDGVLTKDELLPVFENTRNDDVVETLMSFDRNGDGKITPDELPERMRGLFESSGRRALTTADIRAIAARTPPPGMADELWPDGFMRDDYAVSALDDDHDEIISATEIERAAERLRTLDRNGDGKLSADELIRIRVR
jgi:hypothetical protein